MGQKRQLRVKPRAYQPNKAEINEPFRIDATPGQLAQALLRDVDVVEDPIGKPHARRRR